MASTEKRYFARRPFQYGADQLDLDQIFVLQGEVNDERLARLGYCAVVSERASIVQCGYCGRQFVTDAALNNHGRKRHGKSVLEEIKAAPAMSEGEIAHAIETGRIRPVRGDEKIGESEDRRIAQEEERLAAERPLYLEKTKASVESGDTKPPEITTTEPKPRRGARGRARAQASAGR